MSEERYISEIGTAWVLRQVLPPSRNRIYLARITGVEVISAITRRQQAGSMCSPDKSDKSAKSGGIR